MRRLLLIALLFSQPGLFTASAQIKDLVFHHLTRSNGLSIEKVTCLAQDSSGFIWIGSEEGLFRYDGFTYKAFFSDPKRKNSLPGNWIQRIYVTQKGFLWITTFGGGAALLNAEGKVLKIINSLTCPLFSEGADGGNEVKEDRSGNIWITTANGLFMVSPDASRIQRFLSPVKEQNVIRPFIFDAEDNLWLGTLAGLVVFDTKKLVFRNEHDLPFCCAGLKKSHKLIHTLAFYHNELWYSSWRPDVGVYDTLNNTNTIFYAGDKWQPDFNRMATTFYTDSRNNLWIATLSGLQVRERNEKNIIITTYLNEPGNPNSLINNRVNTILEDRDGNFWFGTDKGISIARPYGQWLRNFSINNLMHYPFGNKIVSDIIEIDSNRLLIGTRDGGGLYLTDNNFNLKKHFSFKTRLDWISTHYVDAPRQRVFISTHEGMLLYDIKKEELKIEDKGMFKNRYPVSAFVSISDSLVWVSRVANVFAKWNPGNGVYEEYDLRHFGEESRALVIEKDSKNNIWLLPSGAPPLQFDEPVKKIVHRFIMNDSDQALRKNPVYFFKDLGEYFIIGYETKGISLYHKRSKTYEHFSKSDGMSSNHMGHHIVVTPDSTIWIPTSNGITHFDPHLKKFKSYAFEDGILSNNFEYITQLKDGRIVVGSTQGLISFYPIEIQKLNKPPAAPVFTNIEVYGKSILIDSLFEKQRSLFVPYKKNHFSIEFISLQYNSGRKLEYAFMLEGLDQDWTYAGERRSVTYSKIKGGNYNFRIRVREPGGEWIEAKHSLPIYIQTPFFQQWWFYVLCTGLLAVIVYAIFKYRVQQLLKIEKMRTAISGDLHDEIGSSLTSISIFSQMAMKNLSADSKEEEFLQRIGTRSRESIEKMSDIVWSINPDNDNLEQILVRMKNYSTEIAEAKDISIVWNEAGRLSHLKLSMEQRKNFYLLFKEVINNAVKHSKAKNIYIDLKTNSNEINLLIRDDGVGFNVNESNNGNGLKNIRRRSSLLNGHIEIRSVDGSGTSVEFRFSSN